MLSSIEFLRHILDEAKYIIHASQGLKKTRFETDDTLKRAFVRSLEIIGEATKRVSDDLRTKYPDVAWRSMAGMRDRLIHVYFGIDYDIVWDVVKNKIPKLEKQIESIIEAESQPLTEDER